MPSPRNRAAALATAAVLASGLLGCSGGRQGTPARTTPASGSPSAAPGDAAVQTALARIERRYHARLGLYALDTGTGRAVAYRADERFAYCSTSKALAAGVLLRHVTNAQLGTVVTYHDPGSAGYAPITTRHVRTGMKLRDVVAAALRYSDNFAENLILDRIGGPHGMQAALRGLGDTTTHDDRTEPALNSAVPGDVRDTSTPRALATDLRAFVLGAVLPADRRAVLTALMVTNTTGGPYVRAGVPAGWKVGDKTGNGGYGTRDDIAVVWPPPGRAPIVIAVLSHRGSANASSADSLIADATKAAVAALR